jgi:hypothetical protein
LDFIVVHQNDCVCGQHLRYNMRTNIFNKIDTIIKKTSITNWVTIK